MFDTLGVLEQAVLEVLSLSVGPLSVRQVREHLRGRAQLAYTTIMTVLSRLHGKGLVQRNKRGRAFYYRSSVSAEQWQGHQAGELLMTRCPGARGPVLLAFIDALQQAAPETLDALVELIQERRRPAPRS